ncbi:MAG: hypothetical protein GY765_27565 [bacterium]|nr:hypothetical protein [bacterium]
MNLNVTTCLSCAGPLPVADHQFVTNCRYCNAKYYINQELPPAVVLKPEINADQARALVAEELKHKEIAPEFSKDSRFENAVLYFIPFLEVRGIKAGHMPGKDEKKMEYSFQAYDYLTRANDLEDLKLGYFDQGIVENALANANQLPYDPMEIRKLGVALAPSSLRTIIKKENPKAAESIEVNLRLVYFPIWELSYTYQGILFKNYLSAVEGNTIKVQGMRNHKKKLKLALWGMLSLAILMGRGINVGGPGLFLGLAFGIPLTAILAPYFWELFAFREIVEIRGNLLDFNTVNYTENSFVKLSKKIINGISSTLGQFSGEEEDEREARKS